MSELFTPPRYFKAVAFHRHTDRTIGWLELFYDLVYVATLIQIGNFLSDNLTLLGFGQFLVMMFVVWWSWGGKRSIRIASSNLKLSSWSYGHLFLATSLVVFGVAAKKLFAETINYSGKVVTDEYRLLLTVAVAIFLLALAMINYGLDDKLTPHSQIKRVLVYLGVAVGIAGMGLLLAGLTATQFTGIIAVIMVLVVALSCLLQPRWPWAGTL